jgi:gluconate 2-dehydrogenase gamma chain
MILNSRRTFLKSSFLGTAVIVMSGSALFGAVSPLETLSLIQEDLFPHAKALGTNSFAYLTLILHHSRVSDADKAFIRNGVQWLNEEAVKQYKRIYAKLSPQERQNILQIISKEKWGKNWMHTMLLYIFEATLGDPIYGANKKEAGWKWLHFTAGLPRPKVPLL